MPPGGWGHRNHADSPAPGVQLARIEEEVSRGALLPPATVVLHAAFAAAPAAVRAAS